jgi:hypothetical protein
LYEPGFFPAALGLSEAITPADKAEFRVIQKMGVCDRRGRPYHTVNSYVSDRTLYFGPPAAYAAFSAESDAELAKTRWTGKKRTRTLRAMLEFGKHLDGSGSSTAGCAKPIRVSTATIRMAPN